MAGFKLNILMLFQKMHGDLVEQILVNADAKGTYYAELNANIPIGELIGGGPLKGLSAVAHYGKQEFDNDSTLGGPSYEDYKLGLFKMLLMVV